jgi:hypothetical protein
LDAIRMTGLMKKLISSSVPLILPLLFVAVILIILEKNHTPAWSAALNQYLAVENKPPTNTLEVQQTMHASQPWNFSAAMSASVYRAAYRIADQRVPEITSPRFLVSNTLVLEGAAPLAYPPQDLWCVLLKYQRKPALAPYREMGYSVVYAALHKDLYTAEWVIHTSADMYPSQRLAQTFQAIGCKLEPTTLAVNFPGKDNLLIIPMEWRVQAPAPRLLPPWSARPLREL